MNAYSSIDDRSPMQALLSLARFCILAGTLIVSLSPMRAAGGDRSLLTFPINEPPPPLLPAVDNAVRSPYKWTGLITRYTANEDGSVGKYEGRFSGAVAYDPRMVITCAHGVHNLSVDTPAWLTDFFFFFPQWNRNEQPTLDSEDPIEFRQYEKFEQYSDMVEDAIKDGFTNLRKSSPPYMFNRDLAVFYSYRYANNGLCGQIYANGAGLDALKSDNAKFDIGYPGFGAGTSLPTSWLMHLTAYYHKCTSDLTGQDRYLVPYYRGGFLWLSKRAFVAPVALNGNSGGPVWVVDDKGSWGLAGVHVSTDYGITALDSESFDVIEIAAGKVKALEPPLPPVDEHPSYPGATDLGALGVDNAVIGDIDWHYYHTDEDSVRFSVPSSGEYRIESFSGLDLAGRLRNWTTGAQLNWDYDSGTSEGDFKIVTHLTGGVIYQLSIWAEDHNDSGGYVVDIDLINDGHPDFELFTSSGDIVNYQEPIQSVAKQTDFGNIPVGQATTYQYFIRNTGTLGNNGPGNSYLYLNDPQVTLSGPGAAHFQLNQPGVTFLPVYKSPSFVQGNFQITFAPQFGGTHEVVVTIPNNDYPWGRGFEFTIRGTSPVTQTDDHGNSAENATVLNNWAAVNASLNYGGDSDWFQFGVTSAGTYSIRTDERASARVQLYDELGNVIADSDENGYWGEFLFSVALQPGIYRLKVTGVSDAAAGNYTLRLNSPPVAAADSFAISPGTTATLPILLNDSDPDGDEIWVGEVSLTGLVGEIHRNEKSIIFTAPSNFVGGSFTYVATDGFGGKATTTVSLNPAPAGLTYQKLHSFPAKGVSAYGGIVLGNDGDYYGTTTNGGNFDPFNSNEGYGTVFRLSPQGVMTTLVHFHGRNGMYPQGSMVKGADGHLYGVTERGGESWEHDPHKLGFGTVFRVTTDGVFTKLADFDGSNGFRPRAGLMQASNGNFYGTTSNNNASSYLPEELGSIFQVTPSGVLTKIADFDGRNGLRPETPLIEGLDGELYGTATMGGSNWYPGQLHTGTVFRVTTTGEITWLADLDGDAMGYGTVLSAVDSGGVFFGFSAGGGSAGFGSIFQFAPSAGMPGVWTATKLVDFTGTNGYQPTSLQLHNDTLLYGGTFGGGSAWNQATFHDGYGTLFSIPKSGGPLSLLSDFPNTVTTSTDGPQGLLIRHADGTLRGTTSKSSFVVSPGGSVNLVASFGVDTSDYGDIEWSNLILGQDGNFYGTSKTGGGAKLDSIFRASPSGNVVVLAEFSGLNGAKPEGGLVQGADGSIYGTTTEGGTQWIPGSFWDKGYGTVFKFSALGGLAKIADFDSIMGTTPKGGLVMANDGSLYGTAYEGGTQNMGTVFKVTPGGGLIKIADFAETNGAYPEGGLLQASDGNLYGVASKGGIPIADEGNGPQMGFGTVFKVTPAGQLTKISDFMGSNGAFPTGRLVQGNDGFLYGTTSGGGNQDQPNDVLGNRGTLFRVATAGNLTAVIRFTGNNGARPLSGLLKDAQGHLWGTTSEGGKGGWGTVFRFNPTNATATTLFDFASDGLDAKPERSLLFGNDGFLHGVAQNSFFKLYWAPLSQDLDADGIPDAHEAQMGFYLGQNDNALDDDQDGQSNAGEYLAGTNAKQAGSRFEVGQLVQSPGVLLVLWEALPGRKYTIELSSNLADWQDGPVFTGLVGQQTVPISTGPENLFVRIRVEKE